MVSDQLRLVEAALAQLPRVQWHGDNHHRVLGPNRSQSTDRFRQHAAQHDGGRSHLLVFQQVDQLAQATVVTAVSYGSDERRRQPSAQTAASLARTDSKGTEHPLPANRANAARGGADIGKARPANRQAGNTNQGDTAETTIGREESSEETFSNTA